MFSPFFWNYYLTFEFACLDLSSEISLSSDIGPTLTTAHKSTSLNVYDGKDSQQCWFLFPVKQQKNSLVSQLSSECDRFTNGPLYKRRRRRLRRRRRRNEISSLVMLSAIVSCCNPHTSSDRLNYQAIKKGCCVTPF